MSFQEKIKTMIASIRNELERIEMHAYPGEGEPDYDTISDLTDLIESSLDDIRELIDEVEEAEEKKAKEPEIVKCSCGETFDWEHWDRKTFPVPKGVMEAVRHLDMGHTIGNPKEAEG